GRTRVVGALRGADNDAIVLVHQQLGAADVGRGDRRAQQTVLVAEGGSVGRQRRDAEVGPRRIVVVERAIQGIATRAHFLHLEVGRALVVVVVAAPTEPRTHHLAGRVVHLVVRLRVAVVVRTVGHHPVAGHTGH